MEFYLDELRQVFLKILSNMTENLKNIRDKLNPENFDSKKRQDVYLSVTADDALLKIQYALHNFLREIDNINIRDLNMRVQNIVSQANPRAFGLTVDRLLIHYNELCDIHRIIINNIDPDLNLNSVGIVPTEALSELVVFTRIKPKSVRVSFSFRDPASDLNEYEFIESAMEAWRRLLDKDRQPTPREFLMVHLAYRLIKRSAGCTSLSRRSRFMGVPGFHDFTQTYMALTDPGPGHLYGTVTKKRWMDKGVIVHLEHLERTTIEQTKREPTRDEIESYRIPSIKWFQMTRLHVGEFAPTTLYIGRRLKDSGNFDNDMYRINYSINCYLFYTEH